MAIGHHVPRFLKLLLFRKPVPCFVCVCVCVCSSLRNGIIIAVKFDHLWLCDWICKSLTIMSNPFNTSKFKRLLISKK